MENLLKLTVCKLCGKITNEVRNLEFDKNQFPLPSVALSQQTFTCSKSTMEALDKGVKYVQNYQ